MSGIARRIAADAGAGDEAGAEAGFLDQPGAHAVAAAGHDLEPGLVEKRLHRGGLRTHDVSFLVVGSYQHCISSILTPSGAAT